MSLRHLHLLSLARCRIFLPPKFIVDRLPDCLTYLDVSYTGGWWINLLADSDTFLWGRMRGLRVLKAAGKTLDLPTAIHILSQLGHQLWSIDFSDNDLGDSLITVLYDFAVDCVPLRRFYSSRFFEIEGKLSTTATPGVYALLESEFSAKFNHPDRYLTDSPLYTPNDGMDGSVTTARDDSSRYARLTGQEPIRGDSADDVIKVLSAASDPAASMAPVRSSSILLTQKRVTHLHLNALPLTTDAVECLLGNNTRFIEHFECDQVTQLLPIPKPNKLYAVTGIIHIFRPVYLPNLRVLKIHHSLVTNVPTLRNVPGQDLENVWRSETVFSKKNDLAFPQLFVPDMNPRLVSLTLSHIPQHSTGIVTARLVDFIKLAAAQECNIERLRASTPRRGPTLLPGLRRILLEFEPDASGELQSMDNAEDLHEAIEAFTSVSESAWSTSSHVPPPPPTKRMRPAGVASSSNNTPIVPIFEQPTPKPCEQRLTGGPFTQIVDGEYYDIRDPSNPELTTARVWIGSGILDASNPPAVNAYMRNLSCDVDRITWRMHRRTSASHIAAGAPPNVHIFYQAWHLIMLPPQHDLSLKPSVEELKAMENVIEGIKTFRRGAEKSYKAALLKGNETDVGDHGHWKGKLEVAFPWGRTPPPTDFGS